jgi:hypothetical protein
MTFYVKNLKKNKNKKIKKKKKKKERQLKTRKVSRYKMSVINVRERVT